MYSIDQLSALPPMSAILAILLIGGIDFIGTFTLNFLGLFRYNNQLWIRWQAPIVGAMLFAIVLYPLALAGLTPRFFMQVIAYLCVLAGFFNGYHIVKKLLKNPATLRNYLRRDFTGTLPGKLLLVILFGMFLAAMGPETSADALDYHLGIPIALLNEGGMPFIPEWFSGRLAGNGEVLNAMALSIGVEQFGSLLQYVSLLGILGIILFARTSLHGELSEKKDFLNLLALTAISAPVILFLVCSSKPQMWPIAMTTFAFTLTIHAARRGMSQSATLMGYALICMLVMTASQAKFSFLLGGGVVGAVAFIFMVRQRFFGNALWITLLSALLILAPPVIWKAELFNSSLLNAFFKPWPGALPGTEKMDFAIRFLMNGESRFPFPLSIFLPSSLEQFTSILGIGWLIFIGLRPGRNVRLWAGISASVIVILMNIFLAPHIGRMYLEPYFWLLIVLSVQPAVNGFNFGVIKCLKLVIYCQAFMVIIAVWFAAASLFPGAISTLWRINILEHSADGYEIMRWVDAVLPSEAVLLNGHRSMALSPREAVSTDWVNYVNPRSLESKVYLDRLRSKKVSHILVIGPINYQAPLSGCYGQVLAGPGIGHVATRNPFNRAGNYEAWILEFDSTKLPLCIIGHDIEK